MKVKSILLLVGIFIICGAVRTQAGYLVPGLGVEGLLEIGREAGPGTVQERWNERQGLEFKVDKAGVIVLIKCATPDYATDLNIRVDAPEADLLRRYGAPRSENRNKSGDEVLYRYPGIGFTIKNRQVITIYIFPNYRE